MVNCKRAVSVYFNSNNRTRIQQELLAQNYNLGIHKTNLQSHRRETILCIEDVWEVVSLHKHMLVQPKLAYVVNENAAKAIFRLHKHMLV